MDRIRHSHADSCMQSATLVDKGLRCGHCSTRKENVQLSVKFVRIFLSRKSEIDVTLTQPPNLRYGHSVRSACATPLGTACVQRARRRLAQRAFSVRDAACVAFYQNWTKCRSDDLSISRAFYSRWAQRAFSVRDAACLAFYQNWTKCRSDDLSIHTFSQRHSSTRD